MTFLKKNIFFSVELDTAKRKGAAKDDDMDADIDAKEPTTNNAAKEIADSSDEEAVCYK